ncbi:MAG: hypothetical protein VZQ80_05185 [Lachnospiraceae bacterium]|nr:hypothetical protein [Lachnospiraceae bacterium]
MHEHFWIMEDGSLRLANNSTKVPVKVLRHIFSIMLDSLED